jgi:inner membrane protein involved in colicin E2 resistance
MTNNYKEWFGQSAWVYPDEDGDFLPMLLKTMKDHFRGYAQWQSNIHLDEYPQYLCSAKFNGGSDDIVHLWRDGQTWWQISGEFRAKEEDNVELVLRKCIDDYAKKNGLVKST